MSVTPRRRLTAFLLAAALLPFAAAGLRGQETARQLEEVRRRVAEARAARDSARERSAPRRAPRSWSRGDSLLARAEWAVRRAVDDTGRAGGPADSVAAAVDGAALARASAAADSARTAFLRARRLSALADSLRERDAAFEAVALAYEGAVALVARRLGVDVHPADGVRGEVDAILAAISERADSAAALRTRLDSARSAARRAGDRADSLTDVAGALEARLDSVGRRLERRLRRERRIREVRALFSGDDASVRVANDTLELRLTGLGFEPGEAELPEAAGPLLTRVRSAIRAFPGAEIVVEGHTDSRGAEARNRALSQRRAIAVREHLLLHLPISADRISAAGYGETRPVATNDTEEGRARNRRIEVVLTLPPVAGPASG